jgi:2-phosphosulfolactate phosphatase
VSFDQHAFSVRFEWGEQGVIRLAPVSDAVIVVDVFSFATSVEIATSRGAVVFPYSGSAAEMEAFATARNAIAAQRGPQQSGYSLSPTSLRALTSGTRLVLASRNGAVLSLMAAPTPVFAGCLRNARAVAEAAQEVGDRIAVIAGGERWLPGGTLRPAFEDLLGAGAIIEHLGGTLSPEAKSARAVYRQLLPTLEAELHNSISGKELKSRGFANDVTLAAQLNISKCVPRLESDGAYRCALSPAPDATDGKAQPGSPDPGSKGPG